MNWLITPAYAQGTAPASGGFDMLLLILPMFAVMYFLIIRPQQKRQKQHKEMVKSLTRGDRVMLQNGILGKVVRAQSDSFEIEVEIATDTVITMVRDGVAEVIDKRGAPAKAKPAKGKEGGKSKAANKGKAADKQAEKQADEPASSEQESASEENQDKTQA